MPETLLTLEVALAAVLEHAQRLAPPGKTETLFLREAAGHVLATPVTAMRDQPNFARSTRDGFAVRSADLAAPLRITGLLRAGEHWQGPSLQPGEAIEIMTGAVLPEGADSVLMVEHAELESNQLGGDHLTTTRRLQPGDHVVPRGTEAHIGDVILSRGQLLDAAAIAAAASCGRPHLEVFTQPRVAIVATGDELVRVGDQAPEPWQIHNSNSPALAALVDALGGHAHQLAIARDNHRDLDERITQAKRFDLVLFSGGVSKGKYDLVEQVLAAHGAEFFFTGVRIQPGKPVVFGRVPKWGIAAGQSADDPTIQWTYFLGLPGNPVSTEVCFHLFGATLLRALTGRTTDLGPQFVTATVAEAFEGKPGLTRLLPARFESTLRAATVRPVAWQGSGDTAANARANCYCVVEESGVAEGQLVRVLLR